MKEIDALLLLEVAFPGITCKEAREALDRMRKAGIIKEETEDGCNLK